MPTAAVLVTCGTQARTVAIYQGAFKPMVFMFRPIEDTSGKTGSAPTYKKGTWLFSTDGTAVTPLVQILKWRMEAPRARHSPDL